jgi:hypothetical protein
MDIVEHRFIILAELVKRRALVESALVRSNEGWTFQHIFEGVSTGKLSFWFNEDSIAVLELRTFPAGQVLHCFLGAGTQAGLFDLFNYVKAWGKQNGITRMSTQCRIGFKNRLKKAGWKQPHLWMEIEL